MQKHYAFYKGLIYLHCIAGACPGGGARGPPPPPEIEKQNFFSDFTYIATFLVGNIIFSAIFWTAPHLWNILK